MVFTHIATSIYSCKGETGVAARDALAVFRLAPSGKRTLKFCTKRTHMKHPCWHFFGERSWTLFMLTSNKTARLWHFRGIWDPELGAFSALLFNQPCFFPLSSAGRKLPLRGWLFYQRFSSVLGPSCDDLTRNPSYRNFDLGLCCVQIAMSKCSPRSNHQMKDSENPLETCSCFNVSSIFLLPFKPSLVSYSFHKDYWALWNQWIIRC
jgi:hypothetical protein